MSVTASRHCSEKVLLDQGGMLCTVLGEGDIAGGPRHRERGVFYPRLDRLDVVLVVAGAWLALRAKGQQASVALWYRELGSLGSR